MSGRSGSGSRRVSKGGAKRPGVTKKKGATKQRKALRTRNEQMEDDLKMAREIQQTMLPQMYPAFPKAPDSDSWDDPWNAPSILLSASTARGRALIPERLRKASENAA